MRPSTSRQRASAVRATVHGKSLLLPCSLAACPMLPTPCRRSIRHLLVHVFHDVLRGEGRRNKIPGRVRAARQAPWRTPSSREVGACAVGTWAGVLGQVQGAWLVCVWQCVAVCGSVCGSVRVSACLALCMLCRKNCTASYSRLDVCPRAATDGFAAIRRRSAGVHTVDLHSGVHEKVLQWRPHQL